MSVPSRPTTPYISLDDIHTEKFFTKSRIQKHLRRAGLLNRHGEILTEVEYESKQTDAAIGRENRRKLDDAIIEVLNDMAREHWAYARDHMEDMKKNLLHRFRGLEKQYSRRIQPITIRHTYDGRIRIEPNKSIPNNHSSAKDNSTLPPVSALPGVRPFDPPSRPQSSQSFSNSRSNELASIREELNDLKNKLANFDQKSNSNPKKDESDDNLWRIEQLLVSLEEKQNIAEKQQKTLNRQHEEEKQRIDELHRQFKLFDGKTKPSETDKQQIEYPPEISSVIKELRDRIFKLETATPNLPTGFSQGTIDQAIKISEKKTIEREHVIENLVGGTDDRIKQIERQFAQLLIRFEGLPTSITRTDINQPIQEKIQKLNHTQQDNNQWQNLVHEAINKVNQLENQLSQLPKDYITRPIAEELINRAKLAQQPISQQGTNFDQRFNDLERRLNTMPSPPNLSVIEKRLTQLEKRSRNTNDHHVKTPQDQTKENPEQFQALQEQIIELDGRKLDRQQISRLIDDVEQKPQQQIQDLSGKISDLFETKPDHQMVKRLIQESEARENQQINTLQQFVNENQHALRKMQDYLNNLNPRSDQQPMTTSALPLANKSKPKEDPVTDKLNSKELQTIMPYIELLPTFDMFNENEWI